MQVISPPTVRNLLYLSTPVAVLGLVALPIQVSRSDRSLVFGAWLHREKLLGCA